MTRKTLVAVASTLIAMVVGAALVELWVRAQWDERRGTPGFYVSDPMLGQRLRAGYDGWFAGVPVKINGLGFRDPREYTLAKPAGVFRILVFGDSVTFGHGTPYDTTYPYLLEQHLRAWRPDIGWQVWNLGVPGYNTRQELAYLEDVGARYDPDLVIIGFYENDLAGNQPVPAPSWQRRVSSAVQRSMQRRLYSYELYRRVALTIRFRMMTSAADQQRLQELDGEGRLLVRAEEASADQRLSPTDYFDDAAVDAFICPEKPSLNGTDRLLSRIQSSADEIKWWRDSVAELQQIHREGRHHVMFFINMAPRPCPDLDRFYDGGSLADDDALAAILGDGAPVASSTREFLHYRPSQMPGAGGHSIGNSNRVKADALFKALHSQVLPPLLAPPSGGF